MYQVIVSSVAKRQLEKLDRQIRLRIEVHLRALIDDARPMGAIKLEGREAYRIRVRA